MRKLKPVTIIFISFLIAILVGTLLLKLPISIQDNQNVSWVDSFFISTSAICVTGLTTISDIGATFTVFGKIILTILIQIGGLGCITVASLFFLMIGAKLGINDRYLLKEALNQDKVSNLIKLLKSILKITVVIEFVGVIANMFVFSNYFPFFEALGISIFHSVSSFNNAGFDILGSNSLLNYSGDVALNIITMFLIVLGGLGFIVIKDIIKNKFNYKKLSIHSKIVLIMTVSLIVAGTLVVKLSMGDNITWLQAIFTSVTSRTAGFTTINCAMLSGASIMILSILMVIGASPGSTGGGVKTTTFYTMIKSMISFARGKPTIVNNRKISEESKLKAFTLFFVTMSIIFTYVILLLLIESGLGMSLKNIFFEVCSAFGTVGLSTGITPYFSAISKFLLCSLMLLGRLGPITIMGMWNHNWNKPGVNNVEYLEEKIIIG